MVHRSGLRSVWAVVALDPPGSWPCARNHSQSDLGYGNPDMGSPPPARRHPCRLAHVVGPQAVEPRTGSRSGLLSLDRRPGSQPGPPATDHPFWHAHSFIHRGPVLSRRRGLDLRHNMEPTDVSVSGIADRSMRRQENPANKGCINRVESAAHLNDDKTRSGEIPSPSSTCSEINVVIPSQSPAIHQGMRLESPRHFTFRAARSKALLHHPAMTDNS